MTKTQDQQMFGVDNISDWFDDICCSHTFTRDGKAAMAISLLSNAQEQIEDAELNYARTSINRVKYLLDFHDGETFTRRIVGKLMRYLETNGFVIAGVLDEEESYVTSDPAVAMGHIFAVNEASLRVQKNGLEHGILLIPSNGEDIISDWNYSVDDADGFNAVMEGFTSPGE